MSKPFRNILTKLLVEEFVCSLILMKISQKKCTEFLKVLKFSKNDKEKLKNIKVK